MRKRSVTSGLLLSADLRSVLSVASMTPDSNVSGTCPLGCSCQPQVTKDAKEECFFLAQNS